MKPKTYKDYQVEKLNKTTINSLTSLTTTQIINANFRKTEKATNKWK